MATRSSRVRKGKHFICISGKVSLFIEIYLLSIFVLLVPMKTKWRKMSHERHFVGLPWNELYVIYFWWCEAVNIKTTSSYGIFLLFHFKQTEIRYQFIPAVPLRLPYSSTAEQPWLLASSPQISVECRLSCPELIQKLMLRLGNKTTMQTANKKREQEQAIVFIGSVHYLRMKGSPRFGKFDWSTFFKLLTWLKKE